LQISICGNLMSVSLGWRANVIILSPPDGLMQLGELVTYLDAYLRVGEVPDAPHALNGLQVAKTGDVNRVAAAVDLCEATVRSAPCLASWRSARSGCAVWGSSPEARVR